MNLEMPPTIYEQAMYKANFKRNLHRFVTKNSLTKALERVPSVAENAMISIVSNARKMLEETGSQFVVGAVRFINNAVRFRFRFTIAVAVILRPIVIGFDPLGNFNFNRRF